MNPHASLITVYHGYRSKQNRHTRSATGLAPCRSLQRGSSLTSYNVGSALCLIIDNLTRLEPMVIHEETSMCCANIARKAEARLELYLYQQQCRQRAKPSDLATFPHAGHQLADDCTDAAVGGCAGFSLKTTLSIIIAAAAQSCSDLGPMLVMCAVPTYCLFTRATLQVMSAARESKPSQKPLHSCASLALLEYSRSTFQQ